MGPKWFLLLFLLDINAWAGCPEFETALQKSYARFQKHFVNSTPNENLFTPALVPEEPLILLPDKVTTNSPSATCKESTKPGKL